MTLQEMINKLPFDKRVYLLHKFPDLRFDKKQPIRTDAEFLDVVKKKTMNTYLRWEKSEQFKKIMLLYMDQQFDKDFYEIVSVIRKKALKGDEKSIKLFLQLQKEVSSMRKLTFDVPKVEEEDDLTL